MKDQEIIKKQEELIATYRIYADKMLDGFNNDSGGVGYPAFEDGEIHRILPQSESRG
jgi:hypothetical protein